MRWRDRQKALKRKTGARGLRSIVRWRVLLDTMYDCPRSRTSKVVVDGSVIEHKSGPT